MGVISKAESMRILRETLRTQAMEKSVARLAAANPEEKRKIVLEIDKAVRRELRNHMDSFGGNSIIH